jgi:hypothetical protein
VATVVEHKRGKEEAMKDRITVGFEAGELIALLKEMRKKNVPSSTSSSDATINAWEAMRSAAAWHWDGKDS